MATALDQISEMGHVGTSWAQEVDWSAVPQDHLSDVEQATATLTFVLPPSTPSKRRGDLLWALEDRAIPYDLIACDEDHGRQPTLTVRLSGTGKDLTAKIESVFNAFEGR